MSKASDLIERMEKETGQRIDDNDGDNNAVAGLSGAIAREMGKTPKDDVAVGILILAEMLLAGISPDDTKKLLD